jgi:hypothetical protein
MLGPLQAPAWSEYLRDGPLKKPSNTRQKHAAPAIMIPVSVTAISTD